MEYHNTCKYCNTMFTESVYLTTCPACGKEHREAKADNSVNKVTWELIPSKEDDQRIERKIDIMNILKQAGKSKADFTCQATVEKYASKIMEVIK